MQDRRVFILRRTSVSAQRIIAGWLLSLNRVERRIHCQARARTWRRRFQAPDARSVRANHGLGLRPMPTLRQASAWF